MIEVQMRVGHVVDVVGPETQEGELGHHVLARLRLHAEALGPLGAQAPDRIHAGLRVDAGIEEEPAARVRHQEAHHRHRPWLPRREVVEHAGPVQLDVAAAEREELDHGVR